MGSLVERYRQLIRKDQVSKPVGQYTLAFWQTRVFFLTLEIFFPLWLTAMVVLNLIDLRIGSPVFRARGFVVFFLLLIACFSGRYISTYVRKVFFIVIVYAISCFMILFIGPHSPGLLFMLAATIFGLIFFSPGFGFKWSLINFFICGVIGTLIYWKIAPSRELDAIPITEWVIDSFNFLLLSVVFSILVPVLMRGLDNSLQVQEQLRQELVRKNTELEHFTYYVSHDLQQPLRTVAGFIRLLDNKYSAKLDEKGLEYMRHIKQGSEHMQHLIRELLNFSKAGLYSGSTEILELKGIVERVLEIHQQEIEAKQARIHFDSNITLVANRTALVEIMQNLVENALKYAKKGISPEIWIEGKEEAEQWEISVKDNGIGIDPSFYEKIFVIFERLHTDGHYPGTGIGLAVVKKIVDKLNGKIGVESSPGMGSRFYFTLPR